MYKQMGIHYSLRKKSPWVHKCPYYWCGGAWSSARGHEANRKTYGTWGKTAGVVGATDWAGQVLP
jgi:hypothetical protein